MDSVTYAWETAATSAIDGPVVSLTHYILIYMSTIYIHIYTYTYIYIFHASPGYRIERPKRVVSHYHTEGPENGKNSDTLGTTPTDQRTQNKERKGINHSFVDWSDFWMVWYGL